MEGLIVLLCVFAAGLAGGYFIRSRISQRRRRQYGYAQDSLAMRLAKAWLWRAEGALRRLWGGRRRRFERTPPRIKGNINRRGERIFHLPGSPLYEAIAIDPAKGERWFDSEAEAVAAGWRGPKIRGPEKPAATALAIKEGAS